jgi:hypothetical protein
MGVAVLSALLALISALGAPLWPWWLWATIAAVQVLAPIPFLIRDQISVRYVWRYPFLILLPLIKLPARFRRNNGWYHTPHEGDR